MLAIQADPNVAILPDAAPPVVDVQNPRDQIIAEIARKSVNEFLVGMTFSGMACFFVATPAGMLTLLTATVGMVAINILIRAAAGYATLCVRELENDESDEARQKRQAYETFIDFTKYLCPLGFSRIDSATRNVLIHEGGHALAVIALYKETLPEITISPFEGGMTEFIPEELSAFGNSVGEENAAAIVAAAGAGLAILFATAQLIAGHSLSENYPELSRYLEVTGLVTILEHIGYAASALLRECSEGHDFFFLREGGVSPAFCIALMLLLPLIAKTLLYVIDQLRACCADEAPRPVLV